MVCGGCKGCSLSPAYYCSQEHQKIHWKVHKLVCPKGDKMNLNTDNWHLKYAQTKSGDIHFGKLELVTWDFEEDGEKLTWGGQLKEEVHYLIV